MIEDEPKKNQCFKPTFNKDQFLYDMKYHRRMVLEISAKEAAEQIGISGASISRIESGKETPNLENFGIITAWIGKTPNYYYNEQK
mgnify:CR=1 FL=1